ncbi:MAG: carboxy terminal-processing peptidase [Bacteroidales bacterium]|jgi:carboxyl-terminal processing protease|nr:carboxy terminal-processing peptidase [Bacteroidales bacterium]
MKSINNLVSSIAKRRVIVPFALLFLLSSIPFFFYSFSSHTDKNELILQMNIQLLKMQHFSPPEIDDPFSEKAFNAYLKVLDPFKQYLTQEDIAEMEKYKWLIDDQINNNTYELYDLSVILWNKRFAETQAFYREILEHAFDFTQEESYEADADKSEWALGSAELKEIWRKELKYRTLLNLSGMMKLREDAADSTKKSFEEMEVEARKKVLKSYDDMFRYRQQLKEEDRFSIYVNAIASVFDPHTQYQTPSNKANFDIQMSGQFEGIGATLQVSDGYAKVMDIIPGSASWMQGELKINDLIMRVRQEHEAEAVNIYGMLLDDAVKMIRGKKGTKVTLTVKRIDGSVHDITITRDVVIVEETYAKSAVMTNATGNIRVGYIYLPSFYVDFKHTPTGRSSSEDVAKEVEKLKNEKIQGLILDLRSNGGGSLPDAIRMSGLFVGNGPIVQTKESHGLPRVMQSVGNSAAAYDGPLVILVNSISASASEILAAAMQDYRRAVIIGGPGTYGKGTVQTLADLDGLLSSSSGLSRYKPLGSLKLTIQKFYRINGGSTQLKGVTPDIVLPDIYSELGVGERFEDNSLSWSSVQPAKYNVWKNPVPVNHLQQKSRERTSKSNEFQMLNEQIVTMKRLKNESLLSLNLEKFQQTEAQRNAENKLFDEFNKKENHLAIEAPTEDKARLAGDSIKINRSQKWIAGLKKDIFLEEAVAVIGDLK